MFQYSRPNSAFTLTELLVVIAIIAVLSIVAVPTFIDFLGHNKLKSAALEIAAVCKTARQLAITNRKSYRVIFVTTPDVPNNLYYAVKIYQDADMTIENWRQLTSAVMIYSETVTSASTVNVPYPDDSDSRVDKYNIEFFPDGHASYNCHIGLRETVDTTPQNPIVLNIYNTTGSVRIR